MVSLKSKTFFLKKGEGVDSVTSYLQNAIGLDAYLIKNISSVPLNDAVTQLTVFYQTYPDFVVDSFAPRPGAIITTGVLSPYFDSRVLFNSPVDTSSFQSGAFLVDGVGLDTTEVTFQSNYYAKLDLSNPVFQTSGFHDIRVDPNKITRLNGSFFDYSSVAGYTVNSISAGHIGDYSSSYVLRRRGTVKVDIIRASKGTSPQQCIEEYLSQRGLDKDRLISYTFSSRNDNQVEVFFVYISGLEPQIVEGFPLNNTLLPSQSANITSLTLVFSSRLDKAYLESTNGLFTIESDYATSVSVLGSDVALLDDYRTVRIDLSGYLTDDRVYSIVAQPGIKSLDGVVKVKPEQWVLQVSEYRPGSVNISGSAVSGAPVDAAYLLGSPNGSLPNGLLVSGLSGIQITTTGSTVRFSMIGGLYTGITGHIADVSNPHVTTYTQVGAPSVTVFNAHTGDLANPHQVTTTQIGAVPASTFLSHTGDGSIHFTQGQISITSSQVSDFSGAVTSITSSLSGVSNVTFAAHTGDSSIHFTKSSISHTGIQDIGTYTHAQIDTHINNTSNPHSVTAAQVGAPTLVQFTGHTGTTGIHFTQSQISIPSSQISNFNSSVTTLIQSSLLEDLSDVQYDDFPDETTYNMLVYDIGGYWRPTRSVSDHIADATIHFTAASLTETIQDVIATGTFSVYSNGITGTYNDGAGTFNISGLNATTSSKGVAQFSSSHFTVTNGSVSLSSPPINELDDVPDVVLGALSDGDVLTYDGGSWVNQQPSAGAGDMLKSENLSGLTNVDTARKNLKVRYQIDDFTPFNTNSWTSTSTASGSSYQADPQYYSFMQSYDCQGVVTSSNGIGTGLDHGSLMYQSQISLWPATGICHYFRVAITHTGQALFRFGLTNSNHLSTGDVANGAYFEYNSSTNAFWLACCASGSNRGKATTISVANSSVNTFKWFGIEWSTTGFRFYDFASGNSPIYIHTDNSLLPSIATRASRAFIQTIGNGAIYRGVLLDKFAYPVYEMSLPTGL